MSDRILVTGADGEIARAAIQLLRSRGFCVTGLSLHYDHESMADRVIVGDATSPADVEGALDDVDAVVHLAAIPHPSLGTPFEVYSTNVNATFNVLAAAAERGITRAVIASSVNAFGVPMNPHRVAPAYFPLDEKIPTDIADPYSLSKRVDEMTAEMMFRRWGLSVVALRFPLVRSRAVLIGTAKRVVQRPSEMAREGWAYLDVRDAARAIRLAIITPLTGAHVVGLSAPDPLLETPTPELLRQFAPGVPLTRPIGMRDPLVDTTVASSLLAFEPLHSIHRDDVIEPASLDVDALSV